MKTIIVKTQKEFDKIKLDFSGEIIIKDTKEELSINRSFDNAEISVSGNATIKYVYDNATIKYVSGNATIKYVSDNATILLMTGLASLVLLYSAKKIIAKGMNIIRQIGDKKIDIEKGKDVTFIKIKETIEKNPTFEFYKRLYPVESKLKKAIMYKAVHKSDYGEYYSNYDQNFKYRIGETKEENCSKEKEESCSEGIHISHKIWAVNFGKNWDNMALLECEVNEKDIVVSKDCDGKVRTSKIKVLREVPKSEWYD